MSLLRLNALDGEQPTLLTSSKGVTEIGFEPMTFGL